MSKLTAAVILALLLFMFVAGMRAGQILQDNQWEKHIEERIKIGEIMIIGNSS